MTEDDKATWCTIVGLTVLLLAILVADLVYHQIAQGSWCCVFIRCVRATPGPL